MSNTKIDAWIKSYNAGDRVGLQLVAKYLIKFDILSIFFVVFSYSIHFCYKYIHYL